MSKLPMGRLKTEAGNLMRAAADTGAAKVGERIDSLSGRLTNVATGGESTAGKLVKSVVENVAEASDPESTAGKMVKNVAEGDSPAKGGVKAVASKVTDSVKDLAQKVTGRGGGKGGKLKVINIVEQLDVPLPRKVAYAQWTQFEDFPGFMKKVENVSQDGAEKVAWKAQIFWSHRGWTAKIVDQVPNERIVWKSDGQKGHVDGAVTFHEVTPDLTRILVVLEYYPKGLFEHVGNIWRAQGRRARLEMKHFVRHASTQTILHQDEVEGWQGEIHEGHVVDAPEGAESDEEGSEGAESDGKGSEGAESDGKSKSQPGRPSSQQDADGKSQQERPSSEQRGDGKPAKGKPDGRPSGESSEGGDSPKRPPGDRVRKPTRQQASDTGGSPGPKSRPSAQRQDSARQREGQPKPPRPERRAGQASSH